MSPDPLLHHGEIKAPGSSPERWALLLHGIYGAGRNWASVFRKMVQDRPDLGVLTVDLRGHGDSPALSPPHTVEACAADLGPVAQAGPYAVAAVLGHSFGGKVALVRAATAETPPEQVWVIDSTPDARPPSGSAWRMLEVLKKLPGPFADRGAAVSAVEVAGFPRPVAQWMATNAVRREGGWHWRLDPGQMEAMLISFFETDAWEIVESPPLGAHIHFVKATESGILTGDATERIQAAGAETDRVHLHEVDGGHWLNADNPGALQDLLSQWL